MAHPQPGEQDWISKEEAAKILQVKPRQIEKRAQQGYVDKIFLPRKLNERQARVRYSRTDVLALKAGTPNHCEQVEEKAVAKAESPETALERKIDEGMRKAFGEYLGPGAPPVTAEGVYAFPQIAARIEAVTARIERVDGQAEVWGQLTTTLAKIAERIPEPPLLAPRAPAPEPKPWLTLEEAAAYSGLTKAWLRKEAEAGEGSIAVRDMGRYAKGGRWRFLRADLERAE